MGFWSSLAKIGGLAAAGIAAPMTGGASLTSLPAILGGAAGALSGIGNVASGAEAGRANGRAAESQLNNQQDQLRLRGAQLNLEAPQMRASNSVRGDTLANVQPVNISGPITHTGGKMPTVTGGLSPALLSQNSRQLGGQMSRDALASQMKGDAFTPTPQPQAGGFDKFLNIMGGVGAGAGALEQSGLLDKYGQPSQMGINNPKPTIPTIGNPNIPSFAGWAPPEEDPLQARRTAPLFGGLV